MAAVYPSRPENASINRPQPADLFGSHLGVGVDQMAYPPGVAVGWVEVLGSGYEPAELGSETLEFADAAV